MSSLDKLSVKQRLFVEAYLDPRNEFNGAAAILKAGYKTNHPEKMSFQLRNNPAVKAAIDEYTATRAKEYNIKPEYVLRKITKTIEKAEDDNNHNAVLRGCELLARHLGMFIERQEISGPNGDAIKYEQVREAADAFTSSIASLIARRPETSGLVATRRDDESGA
jgi:hypothetical protein